MVLSARETVRQDGCGGEMPQRRFIRPWSQITWGFAKPASFASRVREGCGLGVDGEGMECGDAVAALNA